MNAKLIYSFTHPIKRNGELTKYFQVLKALYNDSSLTKKEILNIVWPNRGTVVDRGYASNTFSQMIAANLIQYIPLTKTYSLTERGINYVVYVVFSNQNIF